MGHDHQLLSDDATRFANAENQQPRARLKKRLFGLLVTLKELLMNSRHQYSRNSPADLLQVQHHAVAHSDNARRPVVVRRFLVCSRFSLRLMPKDGGAC